ncbi:tyrosine-type recombinase/integrase [Meiothermus taiwanensis]|jgi:integrase/recombinase XerC|uniref:Integrase family protein n=1 Tax=Meiothermus taiwanensis WR-220 TaxID=1339250 RepID=A0ABM6WLI3_9DEIN|nr:tyrosine-type recombinase/integrase [Meiothermus taiwanensis]AWR87998.1 integrase family protein [Meiothermus taiwanensis WR-220]KIQ54969.1 integrase [Meiothermus taiwanensis]
MLAPLANWQDPKKRRVTALQALQTRDEERLLELHRVYLALKGRRRARLSSHTLAAYETGIREFLAWAWPPEAAGPRMPLWTVGSDEVDIWLHTLETEGSRLVPPERRRPLRPASLAARLAAVRSFYRALRWAGVAAVPDTPSPTDPTPAHERRPALPARLYAKLLAHLSGEDEVSKRDHLAARLMGEAGLRLSEVVALDVGHVLFAEGLLEVRRGKGGKGRSVPLSKSLLRELEAWLKLRQLHARAGEPALLINMGGRKAHGRRMSARNLQLRFAEHYRALGFPARYRGVHLLRHTAGTRYYQGLRDLYAVATLLGHTDVNTSAIYAKMDREELQRRVEGLEAE